MALDLLAASDRAGLTLAGFAALPAHEQELRLAREQRFRHRLGSIIRELKSIRDDKGKLKHWNTDTYVALWPQYWVGLGERD